MGDVILRGFRTDGTARDDHLCADFDVIVIAVFRRMVTCHGTHLTAAIDVTLDDGAAADGQLGALGLTQCRPPVVIHRRGVIQLHTASHTAGEDIAALGMFHLIDEFLLDGCTI